MSLTRVVVRLQQKSELAPRRAGDRGFQIEPESPLAARRSLAFDLLISSDSSRKRLHPRGCKGQLQTLKDLAPRGGSQCHLVAGLGLSSRGVPTVSQIGLQLSRSSAKTLPRCACRAAPLLLGLCASNSEWRH
jgi:hypothetical protein